MQRVTSLHDKGKVELNPATLGVYDTIKAGGGGQDSLILGHKDVFLRLSVDVVQQYQEEGVADSSGRDGPRGVGHRVLLTKGVFGE